MLLISYIISSWTMGRKFLISVLTCHDWSLQDGVSSSQLEDLLQRLFLLEFSLTEFTYNNHFSIFSVDYIFIWRKLIPFTGIVCCTWYLLTGNGIVFTGYWLYRVTLTGNGYIYIMVALTDWYILPILLQLGKISSPTNWASRLLVGSKDAPRFSDYGFN